jgi:hypothetical protein
MQTANNSRKRSMLIQCLRSFALATPLAAVGALVGSHAAMAQEIGHEYRASAAAPAEWGAYAQRLRSLFRDELSDDDIMRSLATARDRAAAEKRPMTFTVRAWITGDGKIARLEFSGLDETATSAVRARLMRTDVRAAPPADMLQPIHLKLSLGDKS